MILSLLFLRQWAAVRTCLKRSRTKKFPFPHKKLLKNLFEMMVAPQNG